MYLDARTDVSRCKFDGPLECGWVVENQDRTAGLTVPFLARDEAHAAQWCSCPAVRDTVHYRRVTLRRCHCGNVKVLRWLPPKETD